MSLLPLKILIADPISQRGIDYFKEQEGVQVVEAVGSSVSGLKELIKDVSAIIVRSETKVTKELMEVAEVLRVIGRAGVGVDNIDVNTATERGIVVMNTPTGNTIATAELTMAHMLCSTRPLPQADASMRRGKWDRNVFSGSELNQKNLGVLGLGRIGSEVARRALSFGMRVLAYDPYLTERRAKDLGVELVALEDIWPVCDYITVHMPLNESTRYLIDADSFSRMKEGVRVFNCARGGIIEEKALIKALEDGKVKAAGLDVFEEEPLMSDHPLRGFPNVILTPHLGASTREAQEGVGLEVAEAVTLLLKKGIIRSAVNMPSVDARTLEFLKPYLRLAETLGTIVQQLGSQVVEKIKVTYWGRVLDYDTLPLTRAVQRGFLKRIADIVNDVNAPQKIKNLGIEVEVMQSSQEADFADLIQVETVDNKGDEQMIAGTILGNRQQSRIVRINGHSLEIMPSKELLVLENKDVPGVIGFLGTVLGDDNVNIANMALSRKAGGEYALSVFELDNEPSKQVLEKICGHSGIKSLKLLHV